MANNKTQHYQLSQWAASDKVERLDFNADNAKIDEALHTLAGQVANKAEQANLAAAINRVTALENGKADQSALEVLSQRHTTDVAALRGENCVLRLQEWTIQSAVAAISVDLEPYVADYRRLYLLCRFGASGDDNFYGTLNHITGSTGYVGNSLEGYGFYIGNFASVGFEGTITLYPAGPDQVACGEVSGVTFSNQGNNKHNTYFFARRSLAFSDLESIQLNMKSGTFLAGGTLLLYGLK